MADICVEIKIEGVVQGVGFRPFVYRLAKERGLGGEVRNTTEGVTVLAQGTPEAIEDFYHQLVGRPPRLALITTHRIVSRPNQNFRDFVIVHSRRTEKKDIFITPDVATCEECLREIRDPGDRRYRYQFSNCTNCGPRYTIIRDIPYDRPNTTMHAFPMCPECRKEYDNPADRRFHAQPVACPICGPKVKLVDAEENPLPGLGHRQLKQGKILAVKGLGGFHLACDTRNAAVVAELRRRKKREKKPFAIMCRDMEVVKRYCLVSGEEKDLLLSPAAPIVILHGRRDCPLPMDQLSPGLHTLGVMLPYTPLHHLLFTDGIESLVMTSANISSDPLIADNAEALDKLKGIADYFLLHNRDIHNRCDDSLAAVVGKEVQLYRRARGYVPLPVALPGDCSQVIACGGDLKNTFCLTKGNKAYISQHLGDLNNYGNYIQFLAALERLQKLLEVRPRVIAYDLHPGYMANRYVASRSDLMKVGVQHHHAHMASCMAENGLEGEILGIICDGTGYGTDGMIWGCEILAGGYGGFKRLGHLEYVPLPGGDATVGFPARMALSYLYHFFGDRGVAFADRHLKGLSEKEKQVVIKQIKNQINTVCTSSCGRLFDAVSALLGVCTRSYYEGQAAMELEAAVNPGAEGGYRYSVERLGDCYRISSREMWEDLVDDLTLEAPAGLVAARFHLTVAEMLAEAARLARKDTGISEVALSGGVFQNRFLFQRLRDILMRDSFTVYYHRQVPSGDGGISLGQAMVANEVIGHVSGRSGSCG